MGWPFKEDDASEPQRMTGLGVVLSIVGGVLLGSAEMQGLGGVLLAVGGPVLFVGLVSWAIVIGLAAHAAEQRPDATDD